MAVRDEQTTSAVRRMRRTLDDAGATLTRSRVLALCSGGVDSVALVALLHQLPRGAAPLQVDVLFLDHGVRSTDDIAQERAAAHAVAARCGFGFHERARVVEGGDGVDAFDELAGGTQAVAREWRYAQAVDVADALGCDVVATGHTADDQLECALLGLVGVTSAQSGAMRVVRPLRHAEDVVRLVRPLLGVHRSTIEHVVAELAIDHAEDPSNADPDAYLRNAVRHRVVPPLLDVHPAAGMVVARSAEQALERSAALEQLASHVLANAGTGPTIDVRVVAPLAGAARRAVLAAFLRRELHGHVPTRSIDARLVRAVDALAVRPGRAACARIDVAGGACVRRTGYDLIVTRPPSPPGVDQP
jgi:tRNA(Ile)-lysidine synthetase-like protein